MFLKLVPSTVSYKVYLQYFISWFHSFVYLHMLMCKLCLFFFHLEMKQKVLSRQREYKIAAIQAKQSGNIDQAKLYYVTAKV